MRHFFAFGTIIVLGGLAAGACTASDSDSNPDTSKNTSSTGGTDSSGGTGGTASDSSGGSGGQGVSTSSSGGTTSSGGSAATTSGGAAGMAGDTSTAGGAGDAGMAGAPANCIGDDEVSDPPDCETLSYNQVTCTGFDPPEPFGMTYCKQYAQHATPEAFQRLFECLDAIDVSDDCGEEHDDAVRACRDAVASETCVSELARTKCANFGCPGVDTDPDGTCDVYLSSLTPEGVDHVIACTNEHTDDEPGGTWGAPPNPDPVECRNVFLECFGGTRQPTE